MTVQRDEILKAAKLAKISIPPKDMDFFLSRIATVFNWVEQLQSLDVKGVEPLVNPMEDMGSQCRVLRSDVVTDGEIAKEILSNAPASAHDMFQVPKVIE